MKKCYIYDKFFQLVAIYLGLRGARIEIRCLKPRTSLQLFFKLFKKIIRFLKLCAYFNICDPWAYVYALEIETRWLQQWRGHKFIFRRLEIWSVFNVSLTLKSVWKIGKCLHFCVIFLVCSFILVLCGTKIGMHQLEQRRRLQFFLPSLQTLVRLCHIWP